MVVGSGAVRPGYEWLLRQHASAVLHAARLCMDPDGFARVDAACQADPAISTTMRQWVLRRLTWIMIVKRGEIGGAHGMDYTTHCQLAIHLGKLSWADLKGHHRGIDSLHLASEVLTAWKQRLHHVRDKYGRMVRERVGKVDVLITVRAFYLDLAQ